MTLSIFTHRDFAIRIGGRTVGRREIIAEARPLMSRIARIAGEGHVVEVPAFDPVILLASLEAAWRTGRVPMPGRMLASTSLPPTNAELVIRTSGSTGKSKHVAFDLLSVATSAQRIARYLEIDRRDRVAVLSPLTHGFGLVGQLFAAIVSGAEAIWAALPFPDEQAAALEDATVIQGVAYTLSRALDAGLVARSARTFGTAGGPLPRSLAKRLRTQFPSATIWNQYGCTEAGPRLTACPSTDPAFEEGSVGRPIEGVTLSLSDGRIAFRTDTAMRGYLDAPSVFETGDVGRIDENGNLFVLGRADEVVKVRGAKVCLREVAAAFEACGANAAVAFLSPEEDAVVWAAYESSSEITRRDLRLPRESLPSRAWRVPSLARLPSGKIDRAAVASAVGGLR